MSMSSITNDKGILAGGKLLGTISESFLKLLKNNKSITTNEIKKYILYVINSDEWRKYVKQSLELVDEGIMNLQRDALLDNGYDVIDILYYIDFYSHGLAGVGSGFFKAVFEVGLHMDWILGLPFYPGSTVKGAVRSILEDLYTSSSGSNEDRRVIERVMGSNRGASGFIVLDSYPVGCLKDSPCLILTGDVITPHYYKGGDVVRAEYEAEPTPIQHVAIAPGTVFRVIAGVRPASRRDMEKLGEILARVTGVTGGGGYPGALFALGVLVVRAILEGFGARTGKGYNVFKICDSSCYNNISKNITKIRILRADDIAGNRIARKRP